MKFHLTLKDGKWIGGFYCRKSELPQEKERLQQVAQMWNQPVVATRVDKPGRGQTFEVQP